MEDGGGEKIYGKLEPIPMKKPEKETIAQIQHVLPSIIFLKKIFYNIFRRKNATRNGTLIRHWQRSRRNMVQLVQQQMEAKLMEIIKTSLAAAVWEKAKVVVVAANLAATMVNIIKLNK